MPAYLLDASVLVALAWPEHSAHDRARRWFVQHSRSGWATCPITEMALVRLLSNAAFSPRALTVGNALEVLRRNLDLPGHQFWPDAIGLDAAAERMQSPLVGYRQITDAYLVALAMQNQGKLTTLDRGIAKLAPVGVVEVIE